MNQQLHLPNSQTAGFHRHCRPDQASTSVSSDSVYSNATAMAPPSMRPAPAPTTFIPAAPPVLCSTVVDVAEEEAELCVALRVPVVEVLTPLLLPLLLPDALLPLDEATAAAAVPEVEPETVVVAAAAEDALALLEEVVVVVVVAASPAAAGAVVESEAQALE